MNLANFLRPSVLISVVMQSLLQTEGMHIFSYKVIKNTWFCLLQIFPYYLPSKNYSV